MIQFHFIPLGIPKTQFSWYDASYSQKLPSLFKWSREFYRKPADVYFRFLTLALKQE